jgi:hypothetical protein
VSSATAQHTYSKAVQKRGARRGHFYLLNGADTPRSSFEVPSFRWIRKVKCCSTYFIAVLKEARLAPRSRAGAFNVWQFPYFQKEAPTKEISRAKVILRGGTAKHTPQKKSPGRVRAEANAHKSGQHLVVRTWGCRIWRGLAPAR